jgi:flavodoxin
MMLTYTSFIKRAKNWKLEEIEPMMVNVMDFFNKNIGNYPYKQYSFIQGGDGEWNMRWVRWGNGTLEGILEQLHMSWDILGSNTFWLQWI